MTELQCRVYRDESAWLDLGPAWEQMAEAGQCGTPWQHPSFLRHWWRYLRRDESLRIYAVLRNGKPELILPLQLTCLRFFGAAMTWLEPIGTPNDVNNPRLAVGPMNLQAYACALDSIWLDRREWDGIRIDEKEAQEPEIAILREFAVRRSLLFRAVPFDQRPSLNLQQPWSKYLRGRTARLRKNLRAALKHLETLGQVRCEIAETPDAVDRAYRTMLEVQRRSWKQAAREGLSESTALQEFYRALLHDMAARRAARVLVLTCGGRAIAATFALMDRDTYYSVEIAHDAAFDRFSPGTLLESLELKALMTDGRYARYDPLIGTSGNKLRWAETLQPTTMNFAIRPCVRTRLFSFYHFRATPLARRMGWKRRN